MQIKNIASSVVLGLLFFSLLVIFLVSGTDPLVTGLSVLIVAICLIITLTGDWRAIGVIGVLSAVVSLVAAHLYGQDRYGDLGGVLVPIVWGLILIGTWVWVSRNVVTVPTDQAVLTRRTFSGEIITQTEPIGMPTLPLLDRPLATLPLYTLTTESTVKSLYTKKRQTIAEIPVTISYRLKSRDTAETTIKQLPNRRLMQEETAKSLGKSVDEARLDVRYWERLLDTLMKDTLDDVAREVVRYEFDDARAAYLEQKRLEQLICDALNRNVSPWGIEVTRLQIDKIDITDKDWSARVDNEETRLKAQYNRVKVMHEAQHDAEAERVRKLIAAVREAGIEDISPALLTDIIISATSDPGDRLLDAEMSRWITNALQAGEKSAGDKK